MRKTRWVIAGAAIAALAGCGQSHSVRWYYQHPAAAEATWAHCQATGHTASAKCQRAGQATADIAAKHDEKGIGGAPSPRTGPSRADYVHWGDTQKGRQP